VLRTKRDAGWFACVAYIAGEIFKGALAGKFAVDEALPAGSPA
jgi:hypothetical protein